jgi:hypothetical protein
MSSIGDRLLLEVVFHWGLSSIGGLLPLEVDFHCRLSSIGGCLPLEVVIHWWSSSVGGRLSLVVVFYWRSSSIGDRLPYVRSSSIGGCFHLNHLFILAWSHEPKYSIWGRSDQLLQRYKAFKSIVPGGWVGGWSRLIIMPLRGPILQAEA